MWSQSFLQGPWRPVLNVVPDSGPLPVGHSVLAVVQLVVGQLGNEWLTLQQSRLRVLHRPVSGVEVVSDLKGALDNSVASSLRTPIVFALLCSVRGGDAQMESK